MKDSYGKGPQSFTTDDRSDIAPVGEGVIDFKAILAVKDIAGMEYMIVEQDVSRDNDIFGDIQKSITNLKTKILV
jgi:sugar phosphate isomerase/epimerase